jgi:hypothetical protein
MLQKTDKACGKSFIAEGQKCSKTPVTRPKTTTNADLTRHLLTAGGLAVAGGMLAGIYDFQKDIKGSALPPEAVCPKEPPEGLYDSFKPGDLIYTTFEMAGGHRAHYSVYLGKEDGKHMVIHATAHNEGGKDLGSWLKKESFDSYNPDYSFRKATRSDKAGMVPSTEQLHKLANDLNGRNFKWNGFESNCESFARAITNDLPESLQGKDISKFNKAIVAGIVRTTVGKGWDRSNAVINEEVWAKMKQTTKLDAMIDPKERAERILSPLFNNRPVSVMSVSLTPEGIPTGVFKGMVTPGISRYYTFKMGNQIEYKRIMPKGDGLTKTHKVMREFKEGTLTTHGKPVTNRKQAIAIALSEQARVKKKKRPRGEAFEKADALLARLDKKCGRSGIPDNEKCSVGTAAKKTGRGVTEKVLTAGLIVGGLIAHSRFKAFRAKAAERASNPYGLGEDQKTSLAVYQYAQRNGYDKSFFTRQIKSSSSPSQRRFAKQDLNNFISGEKIHRKNIADSDIITWAQALDNVAPDSLSRKGSPLESANDRQSAVSSVYDASSQSPVFRGEGIHVRKNKTHFTAQIITNEKDSLGRAAPILVHGKVNPGWEKILYTEAYRASKEIGRSFDDSTRRSLDDFFAGNKYVKRGKVDAVPYGIWYKNRTTPVVVNAESSDEARSKGSDRRKESYGAITAVKVLKGADAKAARQGDWVRTRASGKSPEESTQKSKIRPQFFDAEDPCWEGYEQIGTKRQGEKMVPNCVPIKEKADAILERLDKKCGKSGIPDKAKCSKDEGATQGSVDYFLTKGIQSSDLPEARKGELLSKLEKTPPKKEVQKGTPGRNQKAAERKAESWVQDKLPPKAGSAAPRNKKSGRGKKILKGALIGLGALTAANIVAGTALNVGHGIAASRRNRGDSIEIEGFLRRLDASCCKQCEDDEMDVKRKADELLARLDKKCGNSGIPDGAKCNKSGGTAVKSVAKGFAALAVGAGGLAAWSHLREHGTGDPKLWEKKKDKTARNVEAPNERRKADARLDVKCGKGAISFGEKCHSSAVMGAIAMGSAAINSQGFERSVMSHHAVSQNEAREFGRSLSAVHERGGAEKAKEHYSAWAKNVVTMAKKVA